MLEGCVDLMSLVIEILLAIEVRAQARRCFRRHCVACGADMVRDDHLVVNEHLQRVNESKTLVKYRLNNDGFDMALLINNDGLDMALLIAYLRTAFPDLEPRLHIQPALLPSIGQ
jgi:hypothetical protein